MFSKIIKIPLVLETGKGIFKQLSSILKENHLFFESKVLITSHELYQLYESYIPLDIFSQVIFIKGGNYEEIAEVKEKYNHKNDLLIAFGGGSIIDFVKLYAKETYLPYISVPSTLSNDAIYSPIARLYVNTKKESFGVTEPLGIIADIDIISKSPKLMLLAGVGDLVSNFSAIKDWQLASLTTEEKVDNFAMAISLLSAGSIFKYTKKDLFSVAFLTDLANGLIFSGLAMIIANSSRPASGSEHMISHAIDELFPERATLHGLQVAWGQLYIEKNFRKDNKAYGKLYDFFLQIGLMEEIEKNIHFNTQEIEYIINKAVVIRKRYTILNDKDEKK